MAWFGMHLHWRRTRNGMEEERMIFRGVNWSVIYFCFAIDFRKKWRRLLEVTSGSGK